MTPPGTPAHTVVTSPVTSGQRRFPSIQLVSNVTGEITPLAVRVVLMDVGAGVFAIESAVPFQANAEYTFRFGDTRLQGPLRAKSVNCLRTWQGTAAASYLTGFSFVLHPSADEQGVNDLVVKAQDLMAQAHSPCQE